MGRFFWASTRSWVDDVTAPAHPPRSAGEALRAALGRFGVEETVSAQEVGRRGAMLYAAGAALGLVSLGVQHPTTVVPVVLAAVGAAAAIAVALWFGAARLPLALYPLISALGAVMITLVIHYTGPYGAPYALFYVWVSIYAFHFFTPRQAVLQVGLVAVAYAWVMTSAGEYVTVVGTVTIAGVWAHAAVRKVRTLARTDSLTGMPNRRAWDEQLPRALAVARRERYDLCVATLDIDHFKVFNDEQGHQAGDRVLETLAAAWTAGLREGDLLARYGGEEFAILLPACNADHAVATVDRLRARMPRGLSCSAGVALWDGLEAPAALMGRSDAALYEAKEAGRNRSVVAPQSAVAAGPDRLAQSAGSIGVLLGILDRREVGVVFQPIFHIDTGTGEVAGYEALARPLGFAPRSSVDAVFVAAQRMGMVREIDHVCRRCAVEASRSLPHDAILFLNMSVATLIDPEHAADQLALLVGSAGRSPSSVVLEISERETITDYDRAWRAMQPYRELGFRFALDDVGEGHATLRLLATAQPEYVKVAAAFVRRIGHAGERAAVAATCLFAQQTGATVIAEGIETEATLAGLRALGIGLGQGTYLSPPKAVPELTPWPHPEVERAPV